MTQTAQSTSADESLPKRWSSKAVTFKGFDSPEDIAYAAGFFDGEGHCNTRIQKANNGKEYTIIHVSIGQNTPEVLEWFISFWGGNLYTYKTKGAHQWTIVGTRATAFLNQILPYCKVKTAQIQETMLAHQENRKSAPRRGLQ